MFESLAAFRAHCGEPTIPLEDCPRCSKLPVTCFREGVDNDITTNAPWEIHGMEEVVQRGRYGEHSSGQVLRCQTCHRLYYCDSEFVAPTYYFDTYTSWTRYDVDEMFDIPWCVMQRLPAHRVREVRWHGLFPNHVFVRFEDSDLWSTLDHDNLLTVLDGPAALEALIQRDPPQVTRSLEQATGYALFFDQTENPGDRRHDSFDSIGWREPLELTERLLVEQTRAASQIQPVAAERVDDRVRVRFWVTSERRLIRRVITVEATGRCGREDTVVATGLPIPSTRLPYFESLAAFRAHCGTPTMPIEQCAACSLRPERQSSEDDALGAGPLDNVIFDYVKRCPVCRRLYAYEEFSGGGNDIYRGNETTWYLHRHDVDELFDLERCVRLRLPDHGIARLGERFFPHHVLVRFHSRSWASLDADNQLAMLDRESIAALIDRDPPVIGDLERAKRYALLLDRVEDPLARRPDDYELFTIKEDLTPEEEQQVDEVRAATGFATTYPWLGPDATATRDGDRVMVRSWLMSKRRLICRMHTVQPNGHVIVEDAVIAENFPVGPDRVL